MGMIITASRRTDLLAFYSEWFMNRIRAGYCTVPNPFNPTQVAYISLKPQDVSVLVFISRNPRPLMPHLDELDQRGYSYYFHYTLMNNPRLIDPKCPPMEKALETFKRLADRIGPEKMIWRYDPIVLTSQTPAEFHQQAYERIARVLEGSTRRSVISVLDIYKKAQKRLEEMGRRGARLLSPDEQEKQLEAVIPAMVQSAHSHGMEIRSCAEVLDLEKYGVRPGSCVDAEYIREKFGASITGRSNPGQRKACRCAYSRDIGMYDTCLFGCRYCYATSSIERARANHARHEPQSPSLIGWYEAEQPITNEEPQLNLWDGKP